MYSNWAQSLYDPTMLEVSLYFARLVYATHSQPHPYEVPSIDSYKTKALRSVRRRLSQGPENLGDGLMAAVVVLTILDVCLPRSYHFFSTIHVSSS